MHPAEERKSGRVSKPTARYELEHAFFVTRRCVDVLNFYWRRFPAANGAAHSPTSAANKLRYNHPEDQRNRVPSKFDILPGDSGRRVVDERGFMVPATVRGSKIDEIWAVGAGKHCLCAYIAWPSKQTRYIAGRFEENSRG
jgi:hypothetical protein